MPRPSWVSGQHVMPAVLGMQGVPAKPPLRPMTPAKLRVGRRGGRAKTSTPNPHLGATSPGAESQPLGNNGCPCLPRSQRIFPRPRDLTTAHAEMNSLKSGLPDSLVSSKTNLSPRPLPSGSFLSQGQKGFEVSYQGGLPAQTLSLLLVSLWLPGGLQQRLPDLSSLRGAHSLLSQPPATLS